MILDSHDLSWTLNIMNKKKLRDTIFKKKEVTDHELLGADSVIWMKISEEYHDARFSRKRSSHKIDRFCIRIFKNIIMPT